VSITESFVLMVVPSSLDGLYLGLGELRDFAPVNVTDEEWLDLRLTETRNFATVAVVGTDDLGVAVSESGVPEAQFGRMDRLRLRLWNERGAPTIPIVSTDSFVVSIGENQANAFTIVGSSLVSLSLGEQSTITATGLAPRSAVDNLSLSLTDSAMLRAAVLRADGLHVGLTESVAIVAVAPPTEHGLNIWLSETSEVIASGLAVIESADELRVAADEQYDHDDYGFRTQRDSLPVALGEHAAVRKLLPGAFRDLTVFYTIPKTRFNVDLAGQTTTVTEPARRLRVTLGVAETRPRISLQSLLRVAVGLPERRVAFTLGVAQSRSRYAIADVQLRVALSEPLTDSDIIEHERPRDLVVLYSPPQRRTIIEQPVTKQFVATTPERRVRLSLAEPQTRQRFSLTLGHRLAVGEPARRNALAVDLPQNRGHATIALPQRRFFVDEPVIDRSI
jgi:hypothetical protein